MEAIEFIISRLLAGDHDLENIKREASRKYKVMVKNPLILEHFPKDLLSPEIKALLLKKPTKTLSGVTPVAVMIKPQDSCRYGCIYCPFTGLAAKSYTGFEPAAMRSIQFNFDPFLQASNRVKQFEGAGHPTDKCEVIVMGGTFLGMEKSYKDGFIKGVYDGLNGIVSQTLEESIKLNENSKHRVVGLTIETRPDECDVDEMLSFGATRCELGVQHADDEIYSLINRGHKVSDVIDSTKKLKDSAFKVLYHVMPGLPGSDPQKDIGFVKRLFDDPSFRPDMLKIYPTLVIDGTILKEWMDKGSYEPYSTEESADIISEFYRHIPKYVRVMRIQRDIPAGKIESGVKKSNLRELVEAKIREKGIVPNEIRYREVGKRKIAPNDFMFERLEYNASGGKEIFLSFECDNIIAAFLRLRFPGSFDRPEIDSSTALVRELHVYGSQVPISARGDVQHHGFGSRLLAEAETIARDSGYNKIAVISGVGVRQYYRKQGYSLDGPYMSKAL